LRSYLQLRDGDDSEKLKLKMQALAKRLPGSSLDNFKVFASVFRFTIKLVHNISKSASKGLFADLETLVDPQSSEKKMTAAYVCPRNISF